MRTPLLIFLMLLTLILVQESSAVRFALPQGVEGQLVFENTSSEPQEVYQKIPIIFNDQFDGTFETSFLIKPGGALYRDIKEMVQPLQFESHFEGLKIYFRNSEGTLLPVSSGLSSLLHLASLKKTGPALLKITNFSSQPQNVEIRSKGLTGRNKKITEIHIASYGTADTTIQVDAGDNLEIQGQYPIGGLLQVGTSSNLLTPKVQRHRKTDQPGAFFLLANESRSQSYIVRLTDAAHIQSARDQIKNPTGFRARILVGQVSAGSNQENQNLLSPYKHMWSWHISKVFRFAELASQSCDGSPQFIEDILPAWIGGSFNGGSTVTCFWGYRIIEEL